MAKYWCDLCKTFVLDSKAGRAQHESSLRHKNNVERQISNMQRAKREKEKQQLSEIRALQKMGINTNGHIDPSDGSAQYYNKKRGSTTHKFSKPSSGPIDEYGNPLVIHDTIPDSGLIAQPGEWSSVQPDDKKREREEEKEETQEDGGEKSDDKQEYRKPMSSGLQRHHHDSEITTKVYRPSLDDLELDSGGAVKKEEGEKDESVDAAAPKKSLFKKRKVAKV